MPRFVHNGLWINSLLYADDVVIIGAPETMPRLLRAAENHSRSLGYRWNPAKCVVLNPPDAHGAQPLKLGIPFSKKGEIDTSLLLQRNVASGLAAMRNTLQPIGPRTPSFSRLTASRLYSTFIRPCFEYGLAICTFSVKERETLEKGQDQCLRIAFGGHRKASTAVFKHMTNLPSLTERAHILGFKYILRGQYLESDTLLGSLLHYLNSAPRYKQFRWPTLVRNNPIWKNPSLCGNLTKTSDKLEFFASSAQVKASILLFRNLCYHKKVNASNPPVLLSTCRITLGVDPILTLPMLNSDRSRLRRWRMGWLPGRPPPCSCGHVSASRSHLIQCLHVAARLRVSPGCRPNPIDFVLNQLPKVIPRSPSKDFIDRWSAWWPVILSILLDIDRICHPDGGFAEDASDVSGRLFLNKLTLPNPSH